MRWVNVRDIGFSKKKCRYIESQIREKNYFGTDTTNRKCRYREFDVIEMTLYRGVFYKDKKREKKADRRKTVVKTNSTLYGVSL